MRTLAVDVLSVDETLLLARELPHLSALMDGNLSDVKPDVARQLAARALEATRGHPKLLELADAQAAYPERLLNLTDATDAAWREAGDVERSWRRWVWRWEARRATASSNRRWSSAHQSSPNRGSPTPSQTRRRRVIGGVVE
jgi:hypothetical protein